MGQIDNIRNGIIDKVLSITDKSFLLDLLSRIDSNITGLETVNLTPEQKLMLQMSQQDVESGRTIALTDLDQMDLKWLNEE